MKLRHAECRFLVTLLARVIQLLHAISGGQKECNRTRAATVTTVSWILDEVDCHSILMKRFFRKLLLGARLIYQVTDFTQVSQDFITKRSRCPAHALMISRYYALFLPVIQNSLNRSGIRNSCFVTNHSDVLHHVWQLLTSTSRVRITVSILPISGTVATSLPHSISVFRASALTFRFTSPVCTQTCSYSESRGVLITAPLSCHTITFCIRRQNSFTSAFQSNSLSSLFLHPPFLCFTSSPCFLFYLASLIPICCFIILPLSHTAPSPTSSFLSFTAHNPSHRGQVQITPQGRGFWAFRQRYYLTC